MDVVFLSIKARDSFQDSLQVCLQEYLQDSIFPRGLLVE